VLSLLFVFNNNENFIHFNNNVFPQLITIGSGWDIHCNSKWFYLRNLAIIIFYQRSYTAHWWWSKKRPKYI